MHLDGGFEVEDRVAYRTNVHGIHGTLYAGAVLDQRARDLRLRCHRGHIDQAPTQVVARRSVTPGEAADPATTGPTLRVIVVTVTAGWVNAVGPPVKYLARPSGTPIARSLTVH